MLKEYKRKTNIGVGFGLVLQITGNVLVGPEGSEHAAMLEIFGSVLILAGLVLFIWGCISYSKGKGHHRGWGFLGLLSILGLIILALLPDKHKKAASS